MRTSSSGRGSGARAGALGLEFGFADKEPCEPWNQNVRTEPCTNRHGSSKVRFIANRTERNPGHPPFTALPGPPASRVLFARAMRALGPKALRCKSWPGGQPAGPGSAVKSVHKSSTAQLFESLSSAMFGHVSHAPFARRSAHHSLFVQLPWSAACFKRT